MSTTRGRFFWCTLRWQRVDVDDGLFRFEETRTGVPLELPITRARIADRIDELSLRRSR